MTKWIMIISDDKRRLRWRVVAIDDDVDGDW